MNAFLILFIVLALLTHIGARLLAPFRQSFFVPDEPSEQVDLVRSVAWLETFIAIEWLSIGFAVSILIYDFG